MFALYIIYHKIVYNYLYETISEDNKKYITFYGVKDKITSTPLHAPCIYEYELPIYNKELQENRYNESSAFYHVYKNKLHEKYSYVGFLQYDMTLPNETLTTIQNTIECYPNIPIIFASYFATDESKNILGGSLQLYVKPISNFGSILENYNRFFGKKYTIDEIIVHPLIMCNMFVIPSYMYEKYMQWLECSYFSYTICEEELYTICSIKLNRGHIIEICSALFLAVELIEGASIYGVNISHDHGLRV
jgi:hypothetical protein